MDLFHKFAVFWWKIYSCFNCRIDSKKFTMLGSMYIRYLLLRCV